MNPQVYMPAFPGPRPPAPEHAAPPGPQLPTSSGTIDSHWNQFLLAGGAVLTAAATLQNRLPQAATVGGHLAQTVAQIRIDKAGVHAGPGLFSWWLPYPFGIVPPAAWGLDKDYWLATTTVGQLADLAYKAPLDALQSLDNGSYLFNPYAHLFGPQSIASLTPDQVAQIVQARFDADSGTGSAGASFDRIILSALQGLAGGGSSGGLDISFALIPAFPPPPRYDHGSPTDANLFIVPGTGAIDNSFEKNRADP